MKKKYYQILGSLVVLLICLSFGNTKISYKKIINSNLNLSYLSYLYQGDIYNLFKVKKVGAVESITVKEYEYQENNIVIYYLGESLLSPIEGVVVKKGTDDSKYLIIQSNNYEYKISGLKAYNVALYQHVKIGDILGKINLTNNEYKCIITNTTKNDFSEVASLIEDYEAA